MLSSTIATTPRVGARHALHMAETVISSKAFFGLVDEHLTPAMAALGYHRFGGSENDEPASRAVLRTKRWRRDRPTRPRRTGFLSYDFGFKASESARRLVDPDHPKTADELWLSFEPASGELDVSAWSDIVATRVTWDPRTAIGPCREPDLRRRLAEVGEAVMDFLRTARNEDPLVAEALAAERETLSPACRSDPERLAAFLAPDFHEFGASGRELTREGTAKAVAAHTDPAGQPIGIEDLRGVRLADGIVMVTYTSENAGARSHRTSLWRRVGPSRCTCSITRERRQANRVRQWPP